MSTQNVQNVQSKADIALVILAGAIALAGVLGFTFLSGQPTLLRVGVLFGGLVAGLVLAWFTQTGKRFISYAREAYEELRRVVWPSRKETMSTTGIVFAFVVVMALFLFVVDKTIEWVLYDLLLKLG
ncbi:MAG TPA: preprotein translocase subunit SecE [Burkholderiaceae bacterium]|jgi:preprotein translocase subunit SecE|nr:preprotein translocase subunit SecE [Burkholderiaceae bacterium]HPE02776.1 preprotein translocase subunit SecE [Burkholderiaceae bacterium]HRZ02221.1 preprotein translocase subunit SecE [Burkholderiaceae bacterium]